MTTITATDFEQAQAQSLADSVCFCVCGCRNEGAGAMVLLGQLVPGLCDACRKGKSNVRNRHARITSAAMLDAAVNPLPEQTSRLRRIVARVISPDNRDAAVEYAKRVGNESGPTVARIADKVAQGKDLTDAQVEQLLRSKRADERGATAAVKRILSDHKRRARQVDLVNLYIPLSVQPGFYLVEGEDGDLVTIEIERPTSGTLRGFVVVKAHVGEGVRRYGVQYPQPYDFDTATESGRNGYRQTYRGWFPQMVADIIADPVGTRARYDEMMESVHGA